MQGPSIVVAYPIVWDCIAVLGYNSVVIDHHYRYPIPLHLCEMKVKKNVGMLDFYM